MLPSAQDFSKHMSEMGISNDDHIVVYDSVGFGPACRVYWTFKAFGHERVSVLNGGLVKWESEKRPVESGPVSEVSVCSIIDTLRFEKQSDVDRTEERLV